MAQDPATVTGPDPVLITSPATHPGTTMDRATDTVTITGPVMSKVTHPVTATDQGVVRMRNMFSSFLASQVD
jgi:hypothetical protein